MPKRVGTSLYVHVTALETLTQEQQALIHQAYQGVSQALTSPPSFNVVKVDMPRHKLARCSFLLYSDFDTAPFPVLKQAIIWNRDAEPRCIDYRRQSSRPILHRKETLVHPEDPRIPRWHELTRSMEAVGAFQEPHRIGTERSWAKRLLALEIDPTPFLEVPLKRLLPEGEEALCALAG